MVPSDCSEQEWSPSPSQSTYRQPPAMEIGIKCQNKPPVRLKCVSLYLQSQRIGIKCENKPPVRLKRASLHPQAHIGIKCQEKPPVRLKRASLHPQAHIGIKPGEAPSAAQICVGVHSATKKHGKEFSEWCQARRGAARFHLVPDPSHLAVSPTSSSHG